MANYLFSPVGLTDINTDNIKDGKLKTELFSFLNLKTPNLREVGKLLINWIENKSIDFDSLKFQIFDPAIKYFADNQINIDEFFFIASDGPEANQGYNQDTIQYGQILKNYAEYKGFKTSLITVQGIASDFDCLFDNLRTELENLPNTFDSQYDVVYVYIQSATPAMRNALLLNCINSFTHVKHLSQPRIRGIVEEQHFPEKFTDELRKKIYPHALKKACAVILAKNMSHTDGSHVMPYFEENYSKDVKVVLVYSNYLKSTMEFTADSSEGYGNQSFVNYKFKDIGKYLTCDLFSKFADDSKSEVESHFLGKGVADGECDAILEIDEKLSELTVSLPGGETGKTALVVILKNFFRNLYKHSNKDCNNRYIAKLDLEYVSDEFYRISLTEESKTYNIEKISESLSNIELYIKESILTPDLSVRDKGLGIAEMKIAAAYLIGLPLELLEKKPSSKNEIFAAPFFEVSSIPTEDGMFKLKFSFCMLKTKIALIEKNEDWYSMGLKLPEGFDWIDENIERKMRTRHEFIIFKEEETKVTKLKSSNFKQIFLKSAKELQDCLYGTNGNEIHNNWLLNFKNEILGEQNVQLEILHKRKQKSNTKQEEICVFDDHGGWFESFCNSKIESIKSFYYYEKHGSETQPKDLIEHREFKSGVESRVKEIILTNIAIIDERIQKNAEQPLDSREGDFNLSRLYSLKRIFIPERFTNDRNEDKPFTTWDIKNFTGDKCSLKTLMYGEVNNVTGSRFEFLVKMLEYYFIQKNCHYVVLHLSGFETIVNGSFDYLKSRISGYSYGELDRAYWYLLGPDVLGKYIKNSSKYLVLTSGKGTTKTLPDNSYFVSLTNLECALKKNKYELVKLLNSIRKIKK